MSFDSLGADLSERADANLYRVRRTLEGAQQPSIQVDGKAYLGFCSNDYLGLANHPELISAFKAGADRYGIGGGASHLVIGHSQAHHELEEAIAEFTGRPRALLFSTGYMANLGAVNALLNRQDAIFEDKLNHASLLDAGLLSGARFQRYLHNNATSLSVKLDRSEARRKLVVTDGVFSMDGDVAPLPDICGVAKIHKAWVMVDDAHGFGCMGKGGRGLVSEQGMGIDDVQVLMGTFGKAFGTSGAFVAGSEALVETLIQHARTYIYTTSMPPAVACATLASLKLVEAEQWRRDHLAALIQQFKQGCEQANLQLMESDTPILPIWVGDAGKAMAISRRLEQKGFFVTAIRPPTVPHGSARLRVTLTAAHTTEQLDSLLNALAEAFTAIDDESMSEVIS